MRSILASLMNAYTKWRFVEDTDGGAPATARTAATETPKDEVTRLRAAIARERRNLESFVRFNCAALAGPCEDSIRAMEGRLRALEFSARRAM
jgi:hypothetical protein